MSKLKFPCLFYPELMPYMAKTEKKFGHKKCVSKMNQKRGLDQVFDFFLVGIIFSTHFWYPYLQDYLRKKEKVFVNPGPRAVKYFEELEKTKKCTEVKP